MQAIILAAGKGLRMGTLTATTPKPMLPLLGKPLLEWRLAMLPEAISEVILVVGYLGTQIESYFGSQWQGRSIRYIHHAKLDGTGGAIRQVFESGIFVGPALVMNGDDIYAREDLERLLSYDSAVLACELEDASRFGLLATDVEGRLRGIIERPHAPGRGWVNTGAYMLDRTYFSALPVPISDTEYGLPQTLVLVGKTSAVSVLLTRAWQPVGQPEDIALGEAFLREHWLARHEAELGKS